MSEYFILLVTDGIHSVNELHIFRKYRADRERVDPCSAGFFLFQGGTPCNGIVDGHILKTVHLLEVGAKTHEKKAGQGHMVFLAEIHQPPGWLLLQMKDIQGRLCII